MTRKEEEVKGRERKARRGEGSKQRAQQGRDGSGQWPVTTDFQAGEIPLVDLLLNESPT